MIFNYISLALFFTIFSPAAGSIPFPDRSRLTRRDLSTTVEIDGVEIGLIGGQDVTCTYHLTQDQCAAYAETQGDSGIQTEFAGGYPSGCYNYGTRGSPAYWYNTKFSSNKDCSRYECACLTAASNYEEKLNGTSKGYAEPKEESRRCGLVTSDWSSSMCFGTTENGFLKITPAEILTRCEADEQCIGWSQCGPTCEFCNEQDDGDIGDKKCYTPLTQFSYVTPSDDWTTYVNKDYVYVPETAPPSASTTTSISSTAAPEKGDVLGCYNKYTPCGCPYPSFAQSWCNEANSNLGIANQTCGASESVCLSQCQGKWCVFGLTESPTKTPSEAPVTTTTVIENACPKPEELSYEFIQWTTGRDCDPLLQELHKNKNTFAWEDTALSCPCIWDMGDVLARRFLDCTAVRSDGTLYELYDLYVNCTQLITISPTVEPTASPSFNPTRNPTLAPTKVPTTDPTSPAPTTELPTLAPSTDSANNANTEGDDSDNSTLIIVLIVLFSVCICVGIIFTMWLIRSTKTKEEAEIMEMEHIEKGRHASLMEAPAPASGMREDFGSPGDSGIGPTAGATAGGHQDEFKLENLQSVSNGREVDVDAIPMEGFSSPGEGLSPGLISPGGGESEPAPQQSDSEASEELYSPVTGARPDSNDQEIRLVRNGDYLVDANDNHTSSLVQLGEKSPTAADDKRFFGKKQLIKNIIPEKNSEGLRETGKLKREQPGSSNDIIDPLLEVPKTKLITSLSATPSIPDLDIDDDDPGNIDEDASELGTILDVKKDSPPGVIPPGSSNLENAEPGSPAVDPLE